MKKYLALTLALIMVLAMFAGCGKTETKTEAPKAETKVEEKAPAAETKTEEKAPEAAPVDDGKDENGYYKLDKKETYSMGCGGTSGTQYVYMSAMATIVNGKVNNLELVPETTTGGVQNLQFLQSGDVSMGQVEQSSAWERYTGEGIVGGEEVFTDIRAMFPCYTQKFMCCTTSPDLKWFPDLADGKYKIALSTHGGSIYTSFIRFAEFYGINNWEDFAQPSVLADTFNQIGEGTFDGMMGIWGHPSSPLLEYGTNSSYPKLYHPEPPTEEIDKIIEAYPYYARVTIPKEMYTTLESDYHTFGAWSFVYGTTEMSQETVFNICKATFENIEDLIATVSSASETLPENCLDSIVPLHAGTVEYLVSIGIDVPAELIPAEYVAKN